MGWRTGQGAERGEAWTVATGQAARWIALELDLRAPRTWFGPSWAVLGGVVSSGQVPLQVGSLVILAVTWLICEPLLGSLLALSLEISKARQGAGTPAAPPGRWSMPYMRRGSPGRRALDAMAGWLARLASAWRALGGAAERWALLALISVALGMVAGDVALAVVALSVLGLLVVAVRKPLRSEARDALGAGQFLAAWLLGHGAFAGFDYATVLVGLGFAAIWFAWTRRPPLARGFVAAHILLAGVLAAVRAPLAAGGVLLLAVPLFALWPDSPSSQRTYLQHTQVYLMASLLFAAWGLVYGF